MYGLLIEIIEHHFSKASSLFTLVTQVQDGTYLWTLFFVVTPPKLPLGFHNSATFQFLLLPPFILKLNQIRFSDVASSIASDVADAVGEMK
ncbi:hypothetical protein PM082_006477 [Marasmius tenuissimus]|nr:hypothetical protein PM082_006477 [Marasmius tenuissimus]